MVVCEIINGVVANIIEVDSLQWCADNLDGTYVDSQGIAQIGWAWDGTEFIAPEEPEPEVPDDIQPVP